MALNITTVNGGIAKITLDGELDAGVALKFKEAVEAVASPKPEKLVIFMDKLAFMASAGLRILIFAKQKMGPDVGIYAVGAKGPVLNTLKMSGFDHSIYLRDAWFD